MRRFIVFVCFLLIASAPAQQKPAPKPVAVAPAIAAPKAPAKSNTPSGPDRQATTDDSKLIHAAVEKEVQKYESAHMLVPTSPPEPASSWWNVRLTAGLVFVGAVQILAMILQAYLINKTLLATKQAANAATESANTGRLALETVSRPFLQVGEFELVFGERGHNSTVQYTIKNSGNTPAFILNSFALFGIFEGLPEGLDDVNQGPMELVLAPAQSFTNASQLLISEENLVRVRVGQANVVIRGIVKYRDAFGNVHVQGFGRRWDSASSKFMVINDSGYNFERRFPTQC